MTFTQHKTTTQSSPCCWSSSGHLGTHRAWAALVWVMGKPHAHASSTRKFQPLGYFASRCHKWHTAGKVFSLPFQHAILCENQRKDKSDLCSMRRQCAFWTSILVLGKSLGTSILVLGLQRDNDTRPGIKKVSLFAKCCYTRSLITVNIQNVGAAKVRHFTIFEFRRRFIFGMG